jgi:NAD(P)-dependent dehydrogenase (short-subunit alcohol dehydrogenase family)
MMGAWRLRENVERCGDRCRRAGSVAPSPWGSRKAGYDLVVTGRRRDALEAVAAEAVRLGVSADVVAADLARRDSVERLVEAVGPGPLDVLVLNAALGGAVAPRRS